MCNLIHLLSTSFLRSLVLTTGVLAAAQFVFAGAAAQVRPGIPEPSDTIYEVRLSDGTVTFARITAVDRETVVLTTVAGGRLEIDRSHIVDLSPATGEVVNGEFWNEDPSATHGCSSAPPRGSRSERSPSSTTTRWSGSPTVWGRSAARTGRCPPALATSIPETSC